MNDRPVTVTGVAVTPDGWPLPGAIVTVVGPDGRQAGRAVSNANGRFAVTLPGDLPGPATAIVVAAGLDPIARPVTGPDLGTIVLRTEGRGRLPEPGAWTVDPIHSMVRATARHMGMSRVEARFTDLDGTIVVADPVERSHVRVVIEAASIDTGNRDRDAHLRSPDFLDVGRFPTLGFHGASPLRLGEDRWQMTGDLTIRDITRPVTLDVTYGGSGPDPWGGTRLALTATTQLHRADYEITWNMGLPGGLTLIGPTLRIDLDIQAIRQSP